MLNEAKREWLEVMRVQNVNTKRMLEYGLNGCRKLSWQARIPSAGEFCRMAWEEAQLDAGLPSFEQANATVGKILARRLGDPIIETDGALYHLTTLIDREHARQSVKNQEIEVKRALEETITHWKSGKPFAKPVRIKNELLEQKPPEPVKRSEARARIAAILGAM